MTDNNIFFAEKDSSVNAGINATPSRNTRIKKPNGDPFGFFAFRLRSTHC
jgi:hypothetical protein